MTRTPDRGGSDKEDIVECGECGSANLYYNSPEYEGSEMTERILCESCDAEYVQRWTLDACELVRQGS